VEPSEPGSVLSELDELAMREVLEEGDDVVSLVAASEANSLPGELEELSMMEAGEADDAVSLVAASEAGSALSELDSLVREVPDIPDDVSEFCSFSAGTLSGFECDAASDVSASEPGSAPSELDELAMVEALEEADDTVSLAAASEANSALSELEALSAVEALIPDDAMSVEDDAVSVLAPSEANSVPEELEELTMVEPLEEADDTVSLVAASEADSLLSELDALGSVTREIPDDVSEFDVDAVPDIAARQLEWDVMMCTPFEAPEIAACKPEPVGMKLVSTVGAAPKEAPAPVAMDWNTILEDLELEASSKQHVIQKQPETPLPTQEILNFSSVPDAKPAKPSPEKVAPRPVHETKRPMAPRGETRPVHAAARQAAQTAPSPSASSEAQPSRPSSHAGKPASHASQVSQPPQASPQVNRPIAQTVRPASQGSKPASHSSRPPSQGGSMGAPGAAMHAAPAARGQASPPASSHGGRFSAPAFVAMPEKGMEAGSPNRIGNTPAVVRPPDHFSQPPSTPGTLAASRSKRRIIGGVVRAQADTERDTNSVSASAFKRSMAFPQDGSTDRHQLSQKATATLFRLDRHESGHGTQDSSAFAAARESSLTKGYDALGVELHRLDEDDFHSGSFGRGELGRGNSSGSLSPPAPRLRGPLGAASALVLDLGDGAAAPQGSNWGRPDASPWSASSLEPVQHVAARASKALPQACQNIQVTRTPSGSLAWSLRGARSAARREGLSEAF